jgi:hypothetical protein
MEFLPDEQSVAYIAGLSATADLRDQLGPVFDFSGRQAANR